MSIEVIIFPFEAFHISIILQSIKRIFVKGIFGIHTVEKKTSRVGKKVTIVGLKAYQGASFLLFF